MKTLVIREKSWYHSISALRLPRLGWKFYYTIMGLTLSLLLVFYVFSINELTRGVYTIKNYNRNIESLLKENKKLSNQFSNNNFLIKTQDRAQELGFQKTENITYVQILENSLAKR